MVNYFQEKNIRLRFAPSPTGKLHVGGARTALFNWLLARKLGGKFLLRIEDTDRRRSSAENVDFILEGLKFLSLDWDEEPVYQSLRVERHRETALELLRLGKAYRCFCEPEKLEEERRRSGGEGGFDKYPGYCRNLSQAVIDDNLSRGKKFAVRFRVEGDFVRYKDGVHGEIKTSCGEIEDFIILRRDRTPTYMLAVVVDDRDMGITDVIRGDDHISNTPKQILLHHAHGGNPPNYSHVPLILGPDRKRLSKRHGAISVLEYRGMGILGDALRNYLALLGWYPGDEREIMSLEELIEAFSVEGISSKAAVFDFEKLEWVNGHYISATDTDTLAAEAWAWYGAHKNELDFTVTEGEYFRKALNLAKTRIKRISDIFTRDNYYFVDPVEYDEKGVRKHFKYDWLAERLGILSADFQSVDDFTADSIEKIIRGRAGEWGISAAKLIHPLRLAVTGVTGSPGLFELMEVLGRERVIRRVKKVIG